MQPETALDLWQAWDYSPRSRPVIVAELTSGKTNRSYLLDADGDRIVMRLNTPTDRLPGVDRTREIRIWKAASQAGLAPPVLHFDAQAEILITEYIDGASLDRSDIGDALIDRLVDLLAKVHLLEVEAPVMDYAAHIEAFWRLIEAQQTRPCDSLLWQRQSMHAFVSEFVAADHAAGLCHHDPVRENVIDRNDQLFLLDWEYAARGSVVMDFAALCVEWNIDAAAITQRVALDAGLLESAQTIYRYICALWAEVSN